MKNSSEFNLNRTFRGYFSLGTKVAGVSFSLLGLVACGGDVSVGVQDEIALDTQVVAIERSISDSNLSDSNAFKASLKNNAFLAPNEINSPYAFNPGARLIFRESIDVDAETETLLEEYFGSPDYDVKDLNTSPDGTRLVFAAHGPLDHPTENSWNIYQYNFAEAKISRIIADDILANEGQDTSPTFALDGTIVFSSDRSAGSETNAIDRFIRENDNCYKVTPSERPSLLHSMTEFGENITQLTFGLTHDLRTTTLRSGMVAFIRESKSYTEAPFCATASDNTSSILNFSKTNGLDKPEAIQDESICEFTLDSPVGPILVSNDFTVLEVSVDGAELNQLYETVSVSASEEAFLRLDKITQAENGRLIGVLRNQINPVLGGNIIEFQSPRNIQEGVVFAELSPRALITDNVDLYPNQASVGGWFSSVATYDDNSDRVIVGLSNCLIEENGIARFCNDSDTGENVSSQYAIWVIDNQRQARLPVVNARLNRVFSDIAVSQPHNGAPYPFEPLRRNIMDGVDQSTLVCGPIAPIGGTGGSTGGSTNGGTDGSTGGTDGSTGGTDGSTGGTDGSTGGTDGSTGGTDGSTGGTDGSTGGTDGSTGGTDGSTGGTDGSTGGTGGSTGGTDGSTGGTGGSTGGTGGSTGGTDGSTGGTDGSTGGTDGSTGGTGGSTGGAGVPTGGTGGADGSTGGADGSTGGTDGSTGGTDGSTGGTGGSTGGTDGSTGGTDGSTGGTDGSTGGTDGSTGGTDGSTGGTDGSTGGTDGSTGGTDGSTGGTDGSTGGTDGSTGGTDGSTGGTDGSTGGTDGSTGGTGGSTGGTDGSTGGTDGSTGGTDGSTGGTDGSTGGTDGSTGGTDGSTGGTDGSTGGTDGSTGGTDGSTGGTDGSTGGTDGSTGGTDGGSETNSAPEANAGMDKSLAVSSTVLLDGSGSSDIDGDELTYSWIILEQPTDSLASLENSNSIAPMFDIDVVGVYVVELIVNDGELDSTSDTVTITGTVEPEVCDISQSTSRSLPITLRDFEQSHPDFEYVVGFERNIVTNRLGDDGLPVYSRPGGVSTTTTGRSNFDQWYRNVDGVNIPFNRSLTLNRAEDSSVWEFSDESFFPLDGEGFGTTPGYDHNFYFTLEAHLQFDYNGGEVFTFTGDDDLWVYINGLRVIDIGGVHGAISRTISLDELANDLGIIEGESYSFDLFFAERHTERSQFQFQTSINLECVNTVPVADAGNDQSAVPGQTIELSGAGSTDADGDALTYAWSIVNQPEGSNVSLSAQDRVVVNLVPTDLGTYTVGLVVNDGKDSSVIDTVSITSDNVKPVANAGEDQVLDIHSTALLDGSGSVDLEGADLSYSWTLVSKPADSTSSVIDPSSSLPMLNIDAIGTYTLELVVNDGFHDSDPDSVVISTFNVAPTADAGDDQTVKEDADVTLDGSNSFDPDGDDIEYRWTLTSRPVGSESALARADRADPQFTTDMAGTYVAQLIVNDGELNSVADTVMITATEEPIVCDISEDTSRLVPIVLRDFQRSHPDFEYVIGFEENIVTSLIGSDGLPVYSRNSGSSETTTGKDNFNQWFRNVAGVNIPFNRSLTLTRDENSNVWEYSNKDFFPLDGEGWGNTRGQNHNFYFTLETHLQFDYNGGEVFTFTGDDDLWVYINGIRVIDIGGVHGALSRTISLDDLARKLDIVQGESYTFDLFFAERHTTQSQFQFQTSINLECLEK